MLDASLDTQLAEIESGLADRMGIPLNPAARDFHSSRKSLAAPNIETLRWTGEVVELRWGLLVESRDLP